MYVVRRTKIWQIFAFHVHISCRCLFKVLIYILPLNFTRDYHNNATLPLFLDSVSSIEQFVSFPNVKGINWYNIFSPTCSLVFYLFLFYLISRRLSKTSALKNHACAGCGGSVMDLTLLSQIDDKLESSEVAALCFLCRDVVSIKSLEGVSSLCQTCLRNFTHIIWQKYSTND